MKHYCFNWSIIGSTIIKAESLTEAQTKFDEITVAELWSSAVSQDFEQDGVLVESDPGCFDQDARDAP